MTRTTLGALMLLAGGLVAATTPQNVPLPPLGVPGTPQGVDPQMPLFISVSKACDDCARVCDTCSAQCATMLAGGKKEHLATLKLCQDCATICSAASRTTAKDGPMSDLMCTACAEACKRCGAACEKFGSDPIMRRCADECFKCEKACRVLAKGGTATPPRTDDSPPK